MPRIRVSVTLDAPPGVVWADLSQVASHQEWMLDAVAIRFLPGPTHGVGTTFECDTKVGPLRLTDVMEVTSWEAEREMGVVHRGVVTGTGRFVLSSKRRRRTRFTWQEELAFPWWLGGRVGAFAAKPVLAAVWRRNLANLSRRYADGNFVGAAQQGSARRRGRRTR